MEIRKRKPIGKKNIKYIEELYAEYSKRLFFIARKYVENEDFAEDVVQSAFAKVLTYPDGILKVPRDEVFYFLSTVLKHEAYDIIQEEKDNEHESLVYDDGTEGDFIEDPRDNYLQMIDLDSLKYNLSRMKRRHRDTLLFRYVYGLVSDKIVLTFFLILLICNDLGQLASNFFIFFWEENTNCIFTAFDLLKIQSECLIVHIIGNRS